MHLLLCYTAPQRCTCAHDVTSSPQMRTVPYLVDNPRVGFVQARWAFLNAEESFLTKARRPGGLFSSGGVCAYCGMSPEWALISPGPLVRLPLRALARLTPARRACARAGAADLAQLPLQVRAVCALCDRRVLQLQRHRRRVPRRPAPPRASPPARSRRARSRCTAGAAFGACGNQGRATSASADCCCVCAVELL